MLFFRAGATYISIEDPLFRFYLNLFDIEEVRRKVHIRRSDFSYDAAFSFAGEVRDRVLQVVRAAEEWGLQVFYHFDQQGLLWGKDLRKILTDIYTDEALFMLVFLSNDYPEKDWPAFELEIGKRAAHKRTQEYLLPVIVDDVVVVGLKDTVGHLNLTTMTPQQIAELLAEKVETAQKHLAESKPPAAGSPEEGRSHVLDILGCLRLHSCRHNSYFEAFSCCVMGSSQPARGRRYGSARVYQFPLGVVRQLAPKLIRVE